MTTKPPYAIPSMAEVNELPLNGLTAASTFSGGGGSCTGYRMAGWRVAWASEFEPNAQATYKANHPTTILDERDIRTVTGADIEAATGLEHGALDLFDGSPPCQSFSMAGARQRSWGRVMDHSDGTFQRSDDLFYEYARLVEELEPRTFVAENVSGLTVGVSKGFFKRVMARLRSRGYRVQARLLDAQWLGVPQSRRRVFIVGVRGDLGFDPPFPSPLGYRYTMLDACPWLDAAKVDVRQGGWAGYTTVDPNRPVPTVQASQHRSRITSRNGPNFSLQDVDPDEPAPTITAASDWMGVDVPEGWTGDGTPTLVRKRSKNWGGEQERATTEPAMTAITTDSHGMRLDDGGTQRRLTLGEVRRLCGFPDDYVLTGTYNQAWARLGNSVPPPVARAVGSELARWLIGVYQS